MRSLLVPVLLLSLLPPSAAAVEGKWMPEQVLQLDAGWLRAQGLQLPASRLWNAKEGTGLLAAAVSLGGCSAAFISAEGLIVTNHHCLFSLVQQHSTPQNDLIKNGFLASSREAELHGRAERIYVPRKFTDVTAQFAALIAQHSDPTARFEAVERKQKELAAACDRPPHLRCDVRVYDDGRIFMLTETVQLSDVRLVYAPPAAVGNYGGEIDNWMWPRHTGDFAIARAYVAPDGSPRAHDPANVPYRPRFFFPLSAQGVKPGDFVAVLGYPGTTYRQLVAREMEERVEDFYPLAEKAYGEWVAILEEVAKSDDASRIATASTLRTWHNRLKNAQGQRDGFLRRQLLEKHRAQEEAVVAFAQQRPKLASALEARAALGALTEERLQTADRDFLLGQFRPSSTSTSKALWMALQIARISTERQKPDLERDPELMERELPKLLEKLEKEQRSLSPPAERRLIAWFAERARALPAGSRIAALDSAFGDSTGQERERRIRVLLGNTRLLDVGERQKMVTQTPEQLRARNDLLLDLGLALRADYERMLQAEQRRKGASYQQRPRWLAAVTAHAGRPLAPDANSTLRISMGKVQGYSPRDGIWMLPQTTLTGMLAKDTGKEPFALPQKVKDAARRAGASRWRDRVLGDVPVDFLADLDTTGGNSGSPVIDGRGRLVGVNFDRVWENITNDFAFDPRIARNITAEVRYLLWQLEEVEGATGLLQELGVPATR